MWNSVLGSHHEASLAAHIVEVGHSKLVHCLQSQIMRQLIQGFAHPRVYVIFLDPPLHMWSMLRLFTHSITSTSVKADFTMGPLLPLSFISYTAALGTKCKLLDSGPSYTMQQYNHAQTVMRRKDSLVCTSDWMLSFTDRKPTDRGLRAEGTMFS